MDETYFLSIARAFYSTRLHLLTLTEVVRHGVKPDQDGLMRLPQDMDKEMKRQAFDFLLAMFPVETHGLLEQEREKWMTQQ
jgi:hypothetical protein